MGTMENIGCVCLPNAKKTLAWEKTSELDRALTAGSRARPLKKILKKNITKKNFFFSPTPINKFSQLVFTSKKPFRSVGHWCKN